MSISALLIRLAGDNAIVLATVRMLFAALTAWVITLSGSGTQIATDRRANWLIVLAGIALAAHFAFWTVAVRITTVAHATVLVSMHPVIVAVGARLVFGERLSTGKTIGLALALVGAALLAVGGSSAGRAPVAAGNALAAAGAGALAIYLLAGRQVRQSLAPWRYSALVYSVAALTLLPFAAPTVIATGVAQSDLWIAAALALVCTIGGHSLVSWALRHLPAVEVSAAILVEPVFATLLAVPLFGEVPTLLTATGGAVVILALAAPALTRQK